MYAIDDLTARELGTRAHQYVVDKTEHSQAYMELQDCKSRAQTFLLVNSVMKDFKEKSSSISPYVVFEQLMQFGALARGRSAEENKARYFAAFESCVEVKKAKLNVKEGAEFVWSIIEPLVQRQEAVEAATLTRYIQELDLAIKNGQLKKREDVPEAQNVQA